MARRIGILLVAVAAPLSAMYALLWHWVDFALTAQPSSPLAGWAGGMRAVITVASRGGTASSVLIALGAVGAVLYAFVRFWLWWEARGGKGAAFLLSAAIVGALPLLLQAWTLALSRLPHVMVSLSPTLTTLDGAAGAWGWVIQPLSLLLLGIGLLRSRMVAAWVAALAFVAAALVALATAGGPVSETVIGRVFGLNASSGGYGYAAIAEFAFLLALGVSLARRGLSARREAGDVEQAHQPDAPLASQLR
jgi:hypothetical protein